MTPPAPTIDAEKQRHNTATMKIGSRVGGREGVVAAKSPTVIVRIYSLIYI